MANTSIIGSVSFPLNNASRRRRMQPRTQPVNNTYNPSYNLTPGQLAILDTLNYAYQTGDQEAVDYIINHTNALMQSNSLLSPLNNLNQ